ncbi:hypothetical protein BC835DRAFT_1418438 [Cytidiella melzeri]|nr:hypothetical protein BC835DRAFT_1418438 [Cytidiella melzeri]
MMQAGSQDEEYFAEYRLVLITLWIATSATVLFVFEYCITIAQEISLMWLRKWTGATWLYMLNRYVSVLYVIVDISPTAPDEKVISSSFSCCQLTVLDSRCAISARMLHILSLVQYVIFAVFSSLRVYALWNRNVKLGVIVLVIALVPLGVNIYNDATYILIYIPSTLPQTQCGTAFGISSAVVFSVRLALLARLSAIGADILVLVATWVKTWVTYREGIRIGMRVPMASLLIRDGTLYFIALLVMNIYQILNNTIPSFLVADAGTVYISVLTPMLISRFLLNLRQVDQGQETEAVSTRSRFSAIHFQQPRSLVGNMGEQLCDGSSENSDEYNAEDIPLDDMTRMRE